MNRLFNYLPSSVTDEFSTSKTANEAIEFYNGLNQKAEYMFGFPAYAYPLSLKTQYLLLLHYNSPFSNNCGDIEERGNYSMDTKDVEKRIVELYAQKYGMGKSFWGYVSSGGSESNSCGIALAFAKYPNGILYYSQAAHYSVEKGVSLHPHVKIPSLGKDVLDVDALLESVKENFDKTGAPANIVLTHGTTKYGECDDVDRIVAFLKQNSIPYYIHLDAALFGGIQNNQKDAPVALNLKKRGVDSVCVSLHKYVGFPDVKSVFIAASKPRGKKIAYIGQHDTTVSGSRSIPAYALLNHVTEHLAEPREDNYCKNVIFFENLLQDRGVNYYKAPKSNIFVIDSPSPAVCKRFQLSCFDELENGAKTQKAHVIIFPSHKEKIMAELADALCNDLNR